MPKQITLENEKTIYITRDDNGIPHVKAETDADIFYAQGYLHAMDRGLQMVLSRIQAQGRSSELIESSPENLELDIFYRRMNWSEEAVPLTLPLGGNEQLCAEAYCSGINSFFSKKSPQGQGVNSRFLDPWKVADIYILLRAMSYVNQVYYQGALQELLFKLLKNESDHKLLSELFPGKLSSYDPVTIRRTNLPSTHSHFNIINSYILPRFGYSNNWVVSGKKMESGKPFLVNNPVLEMKTLPTNFYEVALYKKNRYLAGASLPGVPGIFMGRNSDVAWGMTYAFTDSVGIWAQQCRGGKYLRMQSGKSEWTRFRERREIIKRRGKPKTLITFYENSHGVLEGDPYKDGYYLSRRTTSDAKFGPHTVTALINAIDIKTTSAAMELWGQSELSMHWTFADTKGDIGYQLSGRIPRKSTRSNGLLPLSGWESKNDWKGFYQTTQLPRRKNPPEGFILTSDYKLTLSGKIEPCSLPMINYRANRMNSLLKKRKKFTSDDLLMLQFDTYSLQAEKFMVHLRPLLSDEGNDAKLKEWDCRYQLKSEGAVLFERFYSELFDLVFGGELFALKERLIDHIYVNEGLCIDLIDDVNRVLLSDNSIWFQDRSRKDLYREALTRALKHSPAQLKSEKRTTLRHMNSGSILSSLFNFHRGTFAVPGSRATPHLSHVYSDGRHRTCYASTYRLNVDFADSNIKTSLLGGPSEDWKSRNYNSDLRNWLAGKFKTI